MAAPEIHGTVAPLPLQVNLTDLRNNSVFEEMDWNEGGIYDSESLAALQDFLRAPQLREAIIYKLADQIQGVKPEKNKGISPLEMFPKDLVDVANWRHLIFGQALWELISSWGLLVSAAIGTWYAYKMVVWLISTGYFLFTLQREHGWSRNLFWGISLGQTMFTPRLYSRWRRYKRSQETDRPPTPKPPPRPTLPNDQPPMDGKLEKNAYLELPIMSQHQPKITHTPSKPPATTEVQQVGLQQQPKEKSHEVEQAYNPVSDAKLYPNMFN